MAFTLDWFINNFLGQNQQPRQPNILGAMGMMQKQGAPVRDSIGNVWGGGRAGRAGPNNIQPWPPFKYLPRSIYYNFYGGRQGTRMPPPTVQTPDYYGNIDSNIVNPVIPRQYVRPDTRINRPVQSPGRPPRIPGPRNPVGRKRVPQVPQESQPSARINRMNWLDFFQKGGF